MRALRSSILLLLVACSEAPTQFVLQNTAPSDDPVARRNREIATTGNKDTTATPDNSMLPDTLEGQVLSALSRGLVAENGLGGVIGVQLSNRQRFSVASGYASPDRLRPLSKGDRFRVGTLTASFVATLVLMLRDEGLLSLEDTLDMYEPSLANAPQIRIRHLLNHTSGVFDFTFSPEYSEARPFTHEAVVAMAAAESASFLPGTRWEFSSTNTVLLAEIIRAVTGESWVVQLRKKILAPLSMKQTYVEGIEVIPDGFVRGAWYQNGVFIDATDWRNANAPSGDAGLVSTAEDLLIFMDALFAGRLLNRATIDEMTTPTLLADGQVVNMSVTVGDVVSYGLGLFIYDQPPNLWYGHTGAVAGFRADLAYHATRNLIVSALVNTGNADAESVGIGAWTVLLAR